MVETISAIAIALVTGAAALHTRVYMRMDTLQSRIAELDKRVDMFELGVSRDFVQKDTLERSIGKLESYMLRIEDKIDALYLGHPGKSKETTQG